MKITMCEVLFGYSGKIYNPTKPHTFSYEHRQRIKTNNGNHNDHFTAIIGSDNKKNNSFQ